MEELEKKWTKDPPINDSDISQWYWYYDSRNNEPEIIEIWPGRDVKRLDGFWFYKKITVPYVPKKKTEKVVEVEKPKKKKTRGRPKGSKNKKKG